MKFLASILARLGIGTPASAQNTAAANGDVMRQLRAKALALKSTDIGLERRNSPRDVWGALMETGYAGGAWSLMVLGDGTVSLYFSTGGGVIGAGQQQAIREAGNALLIAANKYVTEASVVSQFPLPSEGRVTFYFLSDEGVRAYTADEADLGEGREKLSALFHAGHEVVALIRQADESRRASAPA